MEEKKMSTSLLLPKPHCEPQQLWFCIQCQNNFDIGQAISLLAQLDIKFCYNFLLTVHLRQSNYGFLETLMSKPLQQGSSDHSIFPSLHFLDLSRNVSISHRISDFFGIMKFNAEGAMPKSSAVATQSKSGFESLINSTEFTFTGTSFCCKSSFLIIHTTHFHHT